MIIVSMNTVTRQNSNGGFIPPPFKQEKEKKKKKETEKITINTFNDFKKQLSALKEDTTTSALISLLKYCWLQDDECVFNFYKELIEDELEEFGLKDYQYRVTEDMNFVLRYKKKAEALLYIKNYGVDFFINKR